MRRTTASTAGAGADTMVGGDGNDTYVVDNIDDVTTEQAGGGTDTVFSSVSTTLRANVENLTLTGAAVEGFGNASTTPSPAMRRTTASTAGRAPTPWSAAPATTATIVDNVNDVTTEQAGQGTDTVFSSVSTTLRANVENLTLTGSAIEGFGNASNNTITGNAQNNRLDGLARAPTPWSAALGDDRYYQSTMPAT